MRSLRFSIGLALCAALPGAVLAQTTPPSPGAGNAPATGGQPTLSEKLNRTDGVIKPPPGNDTEMTQKPPNIGATMPVIPPKAVTPPGEAPGAPKPEPK